MDGTATMFVTVGLVLLIGLVVDQAGHRLGLPRVTILLLLGFAAGPDVLDILPEQSERWFPVVSTMALTLVGFLLGAEFTVDRVRADGRRDLVIAFTQAMVTALVVSGGLWLAGAETATALLLGGIAVATAPAATLAVIQETRAAGPFTRTIIAVVALDDIIALMVFALMTSAAAYVGTGEGGAEVLLESGWEIVGAVLLGVAIGFPSAYVTGRIRPGLPTREEAYGVALLCAGLALWLEVSFLLAAVTVGITVANTATHHERTFREIEQIEWLALVIFFVLAGASLELQSLWDVGLLGVGYLLLRSVGKLVGCAVGGHLGELDRRSSWWLGAAMLPQAGVAIGLGLLAADRFPDLADDILAVVIGATVVFELFGPVLASEALTRVGEAGALGERPAFERESETDD